MSTDDATTTSRKLSLRHQIEEVHDWLQSLNDAVAYLADCAGSGPDAATDSEFETALAEYRHAHAKSSEYQPFICLHAQAIRSSRLAPFSWQHPHATASPAWHALPDYCFQWIDPILASATTITTAEFLELLKETGGAECVQARKDLIATIRKQAKDSGREFNDVIEAGRLEIPFSIGALRRALASELDSYSKQFFAEEIQYEYDRFLASLDTRANSQRRQPTDHAPIQIESGIVRVDGEEVLLDMTNEKRTDVLAFVAQLLQEPGNWKSGPDIGKATRREGHRWDRIYKALPKPIKSLIESNRRKGYRLLWRK
jgi:hypothetical protein